MTAKCPRCFHLLNPDLYAWECAGQCRPASDVTASRYTGAARLSRPIVKMARPSNARNWTPPRSLPCPSCGELGRDICPDCHYPLPPHWRRAKTLCVALAGARATGKSIYIGVLVKQLEEMVAANNSSLSFADEASRLVYEDVYEQTLYKARGIMPPTARVGTGSTYQQSPMILNLGLPAEPTYLVLRDVAGEDLERPAQDRQYLDYFSQADAVWFLFDPSAVGEVRELLKDYLPTQVNEVGSPERVLENLVRLLRNEPVPIAMIVSKFDTLQALSRVDDVKWGLVMANLGAAFARDRGIYSAAYNEADADLLHHEVVSLLHLLHAQRFVNTASAGRRHRYFTVSALGEAPNGGELHTRGIAPFRCLDPVKWMLAGTR